MYFVVVVYGPKYAFMEEELTVVFSFIIIFESRTGKFGMPIFGKHPFFKKKRSYA